MIDRTPKFAGFAVAFIASTLASSPLSCAQASLSRMSRAGILDAATHSGISGLIRDRAGNPQIGVLVELLNVQYGVIMRTFTDDHGQYSLAHLNAGVYQIKASNPLALPVVRPDLHLPVDSKVIVNLTLSTLYQALQWFPVEPRSPDGTSDDWDWTLRLSANRPLLRIAAPAPVQVAGAPERLRQGAIHSGLNRFGQGGLQQQIVWSPTGIEAQAVLVAAQTAVEANGLGRLSASAAYRQESPDHSMMTVVTFTDRPSIHGGAQDGLITTRIRSASTLRVGSVGEVNAGTELQAAWLGNGATAIGNHPFANFQVHSGKTAVQYSIASAPSMADASRLEQGAAEDAPTLSEAGGVLQLEQGLHQEIRVSRKVRNWTGELGVFHDRLAHPVLEGAISGDEARIDTNNVLYDPGTGTIAISGQGYSGGGVMAMLHDQLSVETWLTLRYAMGEAVTMPDVLAGTPDRASGTAQAAPLFSAQRTSMVAVAAGTRIATSGTVVRGSYRWQPVNTLTQVAPFDDGIPDAYLGFSLRQPLHLQQGGAGKLTAVLDVRNLLAQGYRPFLSKDGTTVFFAQSQRCIAAGVSFSF